eukprot:Sspe_Gene.63867::Locus_37068_Transcript_1_2_Confidence_0.667_Length_1062::g.63867::m.63867
MCWQWQPLPLLSLVNYVRSELRQRLAWDCPLTALCPIGVRSDTQQQQPEKEKKKGMARLSAVLSAVVVVGVAVSIPVFFPSVPFRDVKRLHHSTVIRSGSGWKNEGYLIPHEPLRDDFAIIESAASRELTPQQQEAFARWFTSCFAPQLTAHASSEDSYFFRFFDAVEKEGGVDRAPLRNLIEDHHEIDRVLNASLTSGRPPADLLGFVRMLRAHFDEEERRYRPLFDLPALEKDKWMAAVKESHRAFTLSQTGIVLPHILHAMGRWADAGRREAMVQAMPFPLREALHRVWLPQYYRDHVDAVKFLRED